MSSLLHSISMVFSSKNGVPIIYCLTMPSVGVGAIYTFGITAALAWELPSEPEELLESLGKKKITTATEAPETTTLPLHHDDEDHHRYNPSQRVGSSHFSDEWTYKNNKYPAPVMSYYDPFRLKENFKYASDGYPDSMSKIQFNTSKTKSTYSKGSRNYSQNDYINDNDIDDSYIHPVFHHVHRRTRRELYGKLEKLLTALSKDGKACLKKAICEVSQIPKGKGTMFQELMKTIFRIKPHDDYPDEDDYDKASNKNHDCNQRYPSCQHSVWADMF
ncbi:unnamed protein product [Psylliodes chrysocephalus]|uniref:Uncharacterized protein n=1 Tax=Psylliodes chrysocephalus TaxID=3402493 RepID=A0A9P0D8A0_9CUCU|nr:unnamed protein product [Psylliodes chrysocephala]